MGAQGGYAAALHVSLFTLQRYQGSCEGVLGDLLQQYSSVAITLQRYHGCCVGAQGRCAADRDLVPGGGADGSLPQLDHQGRQHRGGDRARHQVCFRGNAVSFLEM